MLPLSMSLSYLLLRRCVLYPHLCLIFCCPHVCCIHTFVSSFVAQMFAVSTLLSHLLLPTCSLYSLFCLLLPTCSLYAHFCLIFCYPHVCCMHTFVSSFVTHMFAVSTVLSHLLLPTCLLYPQFCPIFSYPHVCCIHSFVSSFVAHMFAVSTLLSHLLLPTCLL